MSEVLVFPLRPLRLVVFLIEKWLARHDEQLTEICCAQSGGGAA